jgi:hypothetical protein
VLVVADWVLAVERAYVAAAVGGPAASSVAPSPTALAPAPHATPSHVSPPAAHALAAAGAVASRFLAVGTPRSFGIVIDSPVDVDAAALALLAHRTWFDPRDIRCAATVDGAAALATATTGRVVSVPEALACDIVIVYSASALVTPTLLRRGTHLNVLHAHVLDPALHQLATIVDEATLPALAAGLIDGRQLDEITICILGAAPIAAQARSAE